MKTIRRTLLDKYLSKNVKLMTGDVIDIGGKKENKRGDFRPPLLQVKSWKYANIDKSTNPDYFCSADSIPVNDNSFDTALLNEVLEHLEDPEKVFVEIFRILRKNGVLICSTPFLFPIHADPYDFQRWTDAKIKSVLRLVGFSDIDIMTMGGIGSVMHDLLLISLNKNRSGFLKKMLLLILQWFNPFFILLDVVLKYAENSITTGYFVTARK